MIFLRHWFASLRDKDRVSPYKKSRMHFVMYIGIDALISTVLVISIFQFMDYRQNSNHHELALERAGAVDMSDRQFFDHIRNERKSAYWLGPIKDARYATDDLAPGQTTITYIQHGTSLYDLAEPKRTVQTFDNMAAYRVMGHPFRDSSNLVKAMTTSGRTVIYDSNVMNSEIVMLPDAPEVIVITYVHQKTKNELISSADELRLVW